MYQLKKEFVKIFKVYRKMFYIEYLNCGSSYLGSVLNGSISCSTIFAKSLIGVRFGIAITDGKMNELLEEYFIKTKE